MGDSLGLSIKAAETDADVIAFCGVHSCPNGLDPLARQDRPAARPRRRLLARRDHRRRAGCATGRRCNPGAVVVMYVNTTAESRPRRLLLHVGQRGQGRRAHLRHPRRGHDHPFGPDMFLGAYVERATGKPMKVWIGESHVHAGIRPEDINSMRAELPQAEFLVHPECGLHDLDPRVPGGRRHRLRRPLHALHRRHARARQGHGTRHTRRSSPPRQACCTPCASRLPRSTSSRPTNGRLSLHEEDHATKLRDTPPRSAPESGCAGDRRARSHPIERMVAIT